MWQGKGGKHELLRVSRWAGEHVQRETFTSIINLEPLIGSLEGAFSICLQRRRRARAAWSSPQPRPGWLLEWAPSSLLEQGHPNLPLALLCWLSPAAPGEDGFPSLLSSRAAGYCLPLYQPSKFP